jgi:hypothetical protein
MSTSGLGSSFPALTLWLAVATTMTAQLDAQNKGVLRGRVLADSTDAPIAGATVATIFGGLAVTTDSLGYFRLAGLPPQVHRFFVRRLGFTPVAASLSFLAGDSVEVDFVLTPLPLLLPELVVPTTAVARKLRDFHDRRRFGMGRFLDSLDIARMTAIRLTDVFRRLPGMLVACPRSHCGLYTMGRQSLRQGPFCPVAVGLDGVRFADFPIDLILPDEVAAIEWYRGPASMPAEFNITGNTCGFVMIWTK